MKTKQEVQERLNKIRNRMDSFNKEFENGNISRADYTQGMDLLEEKEAMLVWVLDSKYMSKTIYVAQEITWEDGYIEHTNICAFANYEEAVKCIEDELLLLQRESYLSEDGYLYGAKLERYDDGQIRAELDEFNRVDLIVEPIELY